MSSHRFLAIVLLLSGSRLVAAPDFWDERLGDYGVYLVEAAPAPGEGYWRLTRAVFQDPTESGGLHHIFFTVLDEDGDGVAGQTVWQTWADGSVSVPSKPAPEMADIPLWGSGWCMDPPWTPGPYNAFVDGLSDEVRGMGLPCNLHVNYLLTFRWTLSDSEPDRPPTAAVEVDPPSMTVELEGGIATATFDARSSDDGNDGAQGLSFEWSRLESPGGDRFLSDRYAGWDAGPTGIGYGDGDDATVLTDMQGSYLSVYLVKWFDVPEGSLGVSSIELDITYDDGFAAYLNGFDVARGNLAIAAEHDTPAAAAIEPRRERIDVSGSRGVLRPGRNLFSVEVHNASLDSSDLSFLAELSATVGGAAVTWIPAGSSWSYRKGREPPPAGWNDPATAEATASGPVVEVEFTRAGRHVYRLQVDDGVPPQRSDVLDVTILVRGESLEAFRRGDCNDDGTFDISDAVFTLGSLFLGEGDPGCDDACDSNDDGVVDISDGIATLGVLFLGDGIIPLPGMPGCGADPTDDEVGCDTFERCP